MLDYDDDFCNGSNSSQEVIAMTVLVPSSRATVQGRNRTAKARQVFKESFASPEDRRAHFSRAGRIGNARRRVLSGDDAAAIGEIYEQLDFLVKKYRIGEIEPE